MMDLPLASALFNLAHVLTGLGRLDEAFSSYVKCFDVRVAVLGPVNGLTLAALNNSAYVLERMGKYAEALDRYQHCVDIAVQLHGDKHVEVAELKQNAAVRAAIE